MRSARLEKQLEHRPSEVFAFLSELQNDPKWRTEITEVKLAEGRAGEPGARYQEKVSWEGIQAVATLTVARALDAEELLIVAEDPGFLSSYEYHFSPDGDGTHLTLEMALETTGPLRLIEPFMWSLVHRWVEDSIDRLDESMDASGNGETPGF